MFDQAVPTWPNGSLDRHSVLVSRQETREGAVVLPELVDGRLPLGRYLATEDEIHGAFVHGKSMKREQVWADWITASRAMLDALSTVPAAWLSGSFLTSKDEPNDLDVVFLVEWPVLAAAKFSDPRVASFIQTVASSRLKADFNLAIDSYILEWKPLPGAGPGWAWNDKYLRSRGYWDDLWSRERNTTARLDAVPSRGYLEVMLDGYT